jgi:eukaryotic-like serine/threonine-protein kinase
MTPARLQRIEEIFYAALDQEPDQINAFLETTCEGDEVVRRKVEVLLASRQRVGSFIETSAAGITTKIIENGDAELLVDQTFGHYKISKRIGSGGMGEVYLATDLIAGRKAALKLLPVRFTGDAERLKRFQQEARAVVALNHPNILTVYEIGEDHSTRYIASELIEGETLRQRLARGRMPLNEAVDVAIQVTSALAAAHEAGIVHRDINPGNIMLRRDGYVKVLDFGIAKLAESGSAEATVDGADSITLPETNVGLILGTVPYISPEQACANQVDKRTDIWSLGVVLYEMVTGHQPFIGVTPRDVMTSILEKEPPPLGSYIKRDPVELQQIVSKTLRKDRSERYQSASEMLQALKNLRHKLELKAASLWLRWTRSPIALVFVLLVSALALALPFYRHRDVTTGLPPQKSIAVLPFENLSKDEENAFFAGGMQDEILTNLAKLADLKVISRTSVMKYKSGLERNLREIAKTLGVSHVVEGSVQRAGGRVRVNAQLIDARNDTHLWAEHYDRDAADIFAIQSEISERIANQLRAKISVAEKAAIAERPTADPVAYAFYAKANDTSAADDWEGVDKSLNRKVELLEKATQHDPNFALAYCELAKTHGDLYNTTWDRKHLDFAKQAAEAAVRVRPDLGVTHLALARYYFRAGFSSAGPGTPGGLDTANFERAREQLAIARGKLPNNPEALFIEARIDRRQNRWDSALAKLQKANDLDPLNKEVAYYIGETYFQMRQYYQWD